MSITIPNVISNQLNWPSDEIIPEINNQTYKLDYLTNGKLQAKETTFEGKIDVHESIKLTYVIALQCINCAIINAEHSRLSKVNARKYAVLYETSASSVNVSEGKLSWINTNIDDCQAEDVEARDGMSLTCVASQGSTKCPLGEIFATSSSFKQVEARDGIHLVNCSAYEVKVSMGTLKIENTGPKATFYHLSARDGINLHNIVVSGNILCNKGKIRAENCQLNDIHSQEGTTLINTSAKTCVAKKASLFITANEKLIYQQLSAGNDISIENIEVKNSATSQFGQFSAIKCILSAIQASERIKLVNTSCVSSKLIVPANKKGILILKDSVVEGDFVIERSNSIASVKYGRGSYSNPITSRFQISVAHLSDLKTLQVTNGSSGSINGKPYQYLQGKFVALPYTTYETTKLSPEIEIEIKGNGVIKGNVIFLDCKGKLILSDKVKIYGSIQNNQN